MDEGQEWALQIAMRGEAIDGHVNIMVLHPTRPHCSSTTWESLTRCTQCRLEVGRFRGQEGALLCALRRMPSEGGRHRGGGGEPPAPEEARTSDDSDKALPSPVDRTSSSG